MSRRQATLVLLSWLSLPVLAVVTVWSGDWRYLLTALIWAAATTVWGLLALEAEKRKDAAQ